MNETGARGPGTGVRFGLGGLVAAVIARLWILPLGSSLSLDELGTAWVTSGSFGDILARARLFPQSLPYMAIVWLARRVGGSSEVVLRFPSLLAAGLAAYWLYRLGQELFDRQTGLLAGGIFVAVPQVCFAVADARPYAFAVLATVGALWMLARWLERGSPADAVAYVLLVSAAVYFQVLFAAMLPVHAFYALRRWREARRATGAQLTLVVAGVAVLTAPACWLAREVGRDRALHAFEPMPTFLSLSRMLVPTGVLAALLGSCLVCWAVAAALGRRSAPGWNKPSTTRDALLLMVLSASVPVILLYVGSWASGVSLFVPRYMMCVIPAQALLMAWLLRGLLPASGRAAVLAGYLVILLLSRGLKLAHTNEDWRGATAVVAAANGSRPVLLSGTFTESRNVDWVQDARHSAYMSAPLAYYPTGGPVTVLPLDVGAGAEAYVERLLGALATTEGGFALIERSSKFPSWAPWLDARLAPKGYRMKRIWDKGNPSAWVFDRSP
jgi:Dolichyl-phosphate-mannose-protein mannosyltransferase